MHMNNPPKVVLIRWNLTLYFPLIKVGHYTRFQILAVLDSMCSKPAALLLFEMTHQTLTATALEKRMVMVGGIDIENRFFPDLGRIPERNLSSQ